MSLAGGLEKTLQTWRRETLGIVSLTLMIENEDGDRPTIDAARTWQQRYGIRSAYVAADPRHSMTKKLKTYMTPLFTIVDPRTMRVVNRLGWRGHHPDEILELARKNRK